MGRLIALTAKSEGAEAYGRPRVVYVNEDAVIAGVAGKSGKTTKIQEKIQNRTRNFEVYEKAMQVEAARNPSSSDILVKQQVALGLTGAGTTQGAGTTLTRYLNETTTIGAGATEAFVLPAATVGKVVVVINNDAAGDAAKVFPASGEFIDDQAVNTVKSIAAGDRVHFVCVNTAGKWVTALDYGK